jgi:LysR family transcriptional activator of nhaA
MQWMNLHHLKYFLVIAEEGSLSAASRKLLVGQPALSAQLKQFEEWLGAELFHRQGKKLVITSTGEYVLKYARAIKNLEDELISNLNHAEDLSQKVLIIGVQESVPKSVLSRGICAVRKVRPVHLKIIEGTGEELFEHLIDGKVDIFIGNFRPMSATKEILYCSLGKEPVSVWSSKDHHRLRKNFPHSLEAAPFILPGFQNQLRHDFEKFMLQSGIGFEVSIEAQDTALQKELSAAGEGLVLLGDESAALWNAAGRLIKIGELPTIKEEYWLGMAKKKIDNDYMKSILNAL